ncbi:MAG: DUF885 domain-containing protein [Candidatus Hodarchaeales archaeon]|jgi:uncharacterized protein (DUF885 family)
MLDDQFVKWQEELVLEFLKENPIVATYFGIHDYDHLLGDSSLEFNMEMYKRFNGYLGEMREKYKKSNLSYLNQIDYDLFEFFMANQNFNFEVLEVHKTGFQGGGPAGNIGSALFSLISNDFAPFEERAKSILGRVERIPEYLEKSKNTWVEPVEVWTKVAIQECQSQPGLMKYISNLVSQDPKTEESLKKKLEEETKKAVEAVENYKSFLETDVLPRSKQEWAIGEDHFSELLRLRHLPFTAEEIETKGWDFYNETKTKLEKIASQIAPGKSFEEVREQIKSNHPTDFETALDEYQKSVKNAEKFVQENNIATIPKDQIINVIETPQFLAPVIPFAAYMQPAYFDNTKIGIYIVTRPKDPKMFSEHSYAGIYNTSVHEAFPGHHLQQTSAALNVGPIRFVVSGIETVEGWAHYCEQMMREEGFLTGVEIEFIQELDVLWRAARIIIDVRMSQGKMSIEDAIEFLIEKVGMEKEGATAEVTRYTYNPGYQLSYLIGKQMVLNLRESMKSKLGDKFTLKFFHDVILKNGGIPFSFLKQIMEHEADKLLSQN